MGNHDRARRTEDAVSRSEQDRLERLTRSAAARGLTVFQLPSGPFIATRWGLSVECGTLDELEAPLARMGVQS